MNDNCCFRSSLATALFALLAAPALAQTSLQAEVMARAEHQRRDDPNPSIASDYDSREASVPFGRINALADSDFEPGQYNGLGKSWSQVDAGGVHVYALSQAVGEPSMERVTGSASASGFMSDHFGLSVPGYASGTVFTVNAQVRIDGTAMAVTMPGWSGSYQNIDVAAFSRWESWVRLIDGNGPLLAELRAREDCDARLRSHVAPQCVVDGQSGVQAVSFQMVNNGGLVQLDMRGWASAGTSLYQPEQHSVADSWSDMSQTIAWAGITELLDANGQVVTDFNAFSATSGFDYRNAYVSAVPEPSSSLLLLGGMALLGGWFRRRSVS